jgi:hypothetical protein
VFLAHAKEFNNDATASLVVGGRNTTRMPPQRLI